MKRLIIFLLLFAAIKVAGQTTGYLRFDTVMIYKVGGTAELVLMNKTKDTLGILTNYGNGRTRFMKSRVINDSTIVVGLDTLRIRGGGTSKWEYDGSNNLVNKDFPGVKIEIDKRFSILDSGYVATSTLTGSNPGEGVGYKTFWHPGKAAFRSGFTDASSFNDAFIGQYSSSFGYNATATGLASFSTGIGTLASGQASAAWGGSGTQATGANSTAGGLGSVSGGLAATAFGNGTSAAGASSFAVGFGAAANGVASSAFNQTTRADGDYSAAFGEGSDVNARAGFVSGYFNQTNFSWVIPQFVIGRYSDTTISSELFRIGWGSHVGGPKANVFTVDTVGHVRMNRPAVGASGDSVLVWDNSDKRVKMVSQEDITGGGGLDTTELKAPFLDVVSGAKDTITFYPEYLNKTGLDEKIDAIDYHVDGVAGNDGNPGTEAEPKLTLSNLQNNLNGLAAHYFRARAQVKTKSRLREKLTVINNVKLGAYGFLGHGDVVVPEITAYDPAGTWTDTAGIYKQTWDHDIQTNQPNYHYPIMDEIDTLLEKTRPLTAHYYMDLASSIANCIATPGTFFVGPLDRDPITVYVHPSDGVDPDANRYRYEITKRSFVVDATSGGTVANGGQRRLTLERLRLRGNGHGYGAVGAGDSTIVRYCILEGCGTHHMVANSMWYDHNLLFGQPKGLANSTTGIVAYKANAAGSKTRISNSIFIDNTNPILAHQSGPASSWHSEIVASGNYVFGDSTRDGIGPNFDLVERVVIENNYISDFTKGFGGLARTFIVRGNIFNRMSERTGLSYPLDSAANLFMDNNFLLMQGDNSGAGMYGVHLSQANFRATFTNNIFRNNSDTRAGSNNSAMVIGTTTTQDQIKSYRNIFIVDETSGGVCNIYVGDRQNNASPYVHNIKSDSNVYILVNGQLNWTLLNPNGGSPLQTTLSDWQTKSGQDLNSIFMNTAWYAAGLKQIFIDPDNGNYNLANTPQGDSIRALLAGMLTPPSFFPRKPTPDEAWASIIDPGSVMDNWKYGVGTSGGSVAGTVTLTGPVTGSGTSTIATTITDEAVTAAKIADGTANRLTGFDGSGEFGEVTIGSGLSLSGGSLSATGGGGNPAHELAGNSYSAGNFLGGINGFTLPFRTWNINRGFLRYNGEWIFGPDSTGIIAGTSLATFKSTTALGGISTTGTHSGGVASVSLSNTIDQSANTQRQIALSIGPTFTNVGGFTNPTFYAVRSAVAINAQAYSIELSNTGTGGATSQFTAIDGVGTTLFSSDGRWQTSGVTPIWRSTSTSATALVQIGTGQTKVLIDSVGIKVGDGTRPTARLELLAGQHWRAPFKWNSGTLLATPVAGMDEFLTDKRYFTITTGAARKEYALNDIALTAGRIPFVTTNGRLTDDATFQYDLTNFMLRYGSTSSNPGLQANGANLRARLADNSASTDLEVADEAYDATAWNGSLEVPTKNAIRDKIESMGSATTIYTGDGTLAGDRVVSGGGFNLSLGQNADRLASMHINSAGLIQLFGLLQLNSESATDANFTSSARAGYIRLPTITAGRTVTINTSDGAGKLVIIWNENSSGNNWSFTNTVTDAAGTTITNLVNDTVYILLNTGSGWLKIN